MTITQAAPDGAKVLDWPGYRFADSEAPDGGDFEAAADAARNLRRLGVSVSYPRPLLSHLGEEGVRG